MFQMENTKIGIAFHDDGTTSFFAELGKSSAKQREHIEEAREEKRAEKKAAEKKAEKELQNYAKSSTDTKRTSKLCKKQYGYQKDFCLGRQLGGTD